jgi:hypothetical protein
MPETPSQRILMYAYRSVLTSETRKLKRVNNKFLTDKQVDAVLVPQVFSKRSPVRSNTRIILEYAHRIPVILPVSIPILPLLAAIIDLLQFLRSHHLPQVLLTLHNLQRQSARSMPGNMAVEQPRARVISFEGDNKVSSC